MEILYKDYECECETTFKSEVSVLSDMTRSKETRTLQFGCLMIETNGVWRPTYERLYPKEMLREKKDEVELGEGEIVTVEHLRFALTGEVTAVYDKIPQTEITARMARTSMAEEDVIPQYEESQGYFSDFRAALNIRNNMFYLLANQRDDVFDDLSFRILEPNQEAHTRIRTEKGVYALEAVLQIRDGRTEYGPETRVCEDSLTEQEIKNAFERVAIENNALYDYGTKTYVFPSDPRGLRKKAILDTVMLKGKEGFAYVTQGQNKCFFIYGLPEEQEILCNEILEKLNTAT